MRDAVTLVVAGLVIVGGLFLLLPVLVIYGAPLLAVFLGLFFGG